MRRGDRVYVFFAELGLGPVDYPGCAMCPAIVVKSQQAEHL